MRMNTLVALSIASSLALTTGAAAHSGHGIVPDLAHGFTHPLGGLDHVLAMVAVGVFAAQLAGRATWLVPATFIIMMVAGGIFGYSGLQLPMVEQGIGLSVVALGVLVALGFRPTLIVSMGLVSIFAVLHGHAHGAEGANAAALLPYTAGFVAATALLHLAGIALGLGIERFSATASVSIKRMIGAAGAIAGAVLLVT